jgi:hypothetical protein
MWGMLVTIQFRIFSLLLFSLKNLKIKIYKTITAPVVLYECQTLFLIIRKENGLRVFENRVLKRIYTHKRGEQEGEENSIIMGLIIYTFN